VTGPAARPPAGDVTVTGSANVQVGSNNVNNALNVDWAAVPAPSSVTAAAGTDNLPVGSAVFEGRDLTVLADVLYGDGPTGVVVGQAAIFGLGGIGKTELAVHYAQNFRDRYSLIWWINADTVANVQLGLAGLTARLHPVATLADAQAWAIGWLQSHPDWLLVLDNVENITDIEPLLGQLAGRGLVLVTTRRDLGAARWARFGLAPLRLGVLDRAASVRLLSQLTGLDDVDGADRLAAMLGDLPLALEQAAAYVSQHSGLGFDEYVQLLANRFGRVSADPGEGGSAQRTVATIWQTSVAAVDARSPLAVQALQVMAWLAPDALPEDVLGPLADDPMDLSDALAMLASFNLITRSGRAVSVHRLVQAVTRAGQDPDTLETKEMPAVAVAVRLLHAAIPEDPINNVAGWPRWNALLPHIDALAEHLGDAHTETDLMWIGDQAATYRQFQGQLRAAITGFEQVLAARRRVLGNEHPDTLTSRHNLALAYRHAGQVSEAIILFEQVVGDRRRVLGDGHHHTLISRDNLAATYRLAGRVTEAITLLEKDVVEYRRVLGDEHQDTLISRDNLANAYRAAGRATEAIILYEQVLVDFRRILGAEHPSTLYCRHNLASTLQSAGRTAEAIILYEQVLADFRRIFGDLNPGTITACDDLARAFEQAGRAADAITLFEEVVGNRRQLLGDDHPRTLTSRNNLGRAYQKAGRVIDAIALYELLLADVRRLLGDDHSTTQDTAALLRSVRSETKTDKPSPMSGR
jgi:tetratricopeptide (TPR) repeat protein